MTVGQLEGINTTGSLQGETWADGDVLYLSPTTAGALTNVKPTGATGHIVIIGYVEYAHANNGKIYVKVMNGWELDELHNVAISSVANNQGLFYESSSDLWKNKSIATVLGYTPISLTSLSASSPLSYNNTTGAFSISQASGSANGFLSSTDWTTFNNKQNALTNPITGTGSSGQIAYFNGTTTQTGSAFLTWDNTDGILSTNSIYNFNNTTNAYMLSSNGENIGSIFNVTSAKWALGYGTSTTALGTPALTWDNSGNIGIGTTSPTTKLHIVGSTYSTSGYFVPNASQISFTTLNGSNGMLVNGSTGKVVFMSGTNETMALDSSGKVGIGTTSPTGKLSLYDTADLWINIARGTSFVNIGVDSTGTFYNTNSNHRWLYNSGSNEGMRLTNAGNVGIGTSSPTNYSGYTTLSINNATNGGLIDLQYNGTSAFRISGEATQNAVFGATNIPLVFSTNSIERMRIASGGNVGIGTTSPTETFTVAGSARITGQAIDFGTGTRGINIDVITSSNNGRIYMVNGGGTAGDLLLGTASTERMRITSAGEVCIATSSTFDSGRLNLISPANVYNILTIRNSWSGQQGNYIVFSGYTGTTTGTIAQLNSNSILFSTSSDYRLKEDLQEIKGLEKVSAIKVYDFKWKDSKDRMDGVLAHELQEVIPYAVNGKKDELNKNGSIKTQGVDYSKLVPIMVKAIQELKAEIDELKAKIK